MPRISPPSTPLRHLHVACLSFCSGSLSCCCPDTCRQGMPLKRQPCPQAYSKATVWSPPENELTTSTSPICPPDFGNPLWPGLTTSQAALLPTGDVAGVGAWRVVWPWQSPCPHENGQGWQPHRSEGGLNDVNPEHGSASRKRSKQGEMPPQMAVPGPAGLLWLSLPRTPLSHASLPISLLSPLMPVHSPWIIIPDSDTPCASAGPEGHRGLWSSHRPCPWTRLAGPGWLGPRHFV